MQHRKHKDFICHILIDLVFRFRFFCLRGILFIFASIVVGCSPPPDPLNLSASQYTAGLDPEISQIVGSLGSKEEAASVLQDVIRSSGSIVWEGNWLRNEGYFRSKSNPQPPLHPTRDAIVDPLSIRTQYFILRTEVVNQEISSRYTRTTYKILGEDKYPVEVIFAGVNDIFYCDLKRDKQKKLYFMGNELWRSEDKFWIGLSRKPVPDTFFQDYNEMYGYKPGSKVHYDWRSYPSKEHWPFFFELFMSREKGYAVLAALDVLCPNIRHVNESYTAHDSEP